METHRENQFDTDDELCEAEIKMSPLLDGKLAAAARGSKLSKNEGSCNSIICSFSQKEQKNEED